MVLVQSYVGTSANIVAEEKQTLLPTAKSSHHQVANLVSFLDKVGPVLVLEKYILQNWRNTFYRIREIRFTKSDKYIWKSRPPLVGKLGSFPGQSWTSTGFGKYILQNQKNTFYRDREIQFTESEKWSQVKSPPGGKLGFFPEQSWTSLGFGEVHSTEPEKYIL